jgi:photosystem II stability/assembly factor-like uncharacterized protein
MKPHLSRVAVIASIFFVLGGAIAFGIIQGVERWRRGYYEILDASFGDPQTGFIAGRYGPPDGVSQGFVSATSDGGKTWTSNYRFRERLFAVEVLGAGQAIVAGYGEILRTDDAGMTWARIWDGGEASREEPISALCFSGFGTGLALGSRVLLRTDDGGRSFSPLGTQAPWRHEPSSCALAANGKTAFVSVRSESLFKSTDGGKSWAAIRPMEGEAWYQSASFLPDGERGWVGSSIPSQQKSSVVLATEDGGATWRRIAIDGLDELSALALSPDGARGWVADRSGALFATSDGGTSWKQLAAFDGSPSRLRFIGSGEQGVAVLPDKVAITADGWATRSYVKP